MSRISPLIFSILCSFSLMIVVGTARTDQLKFDKCPTSCLPTYECEEDMNVFGKSISPSNKEQAKEMEPYLNVTCKVPGEICCPVLDCGNKFEDKYPWLAILEYQNPLRTIVYNCGGALISSRFVLTAARCVHDTLISVHLGMDLKNPTTVDIDRRIKHEQYPGGGTLYDVALLRLDRDVTLVPICLTDYPTSSRNEKDTYLVVGWNALKEEKRLKFTRKDVSTVQKIDKLECSTLGDWPEDVMCMRALETKTSKSINGNRGVPVMAVDDKTSRLTTVGIFIRTDDCDSPQKCKIGFWDLTIDNTFGMYTDLRMHKSWIMETMSKNAVDDVNDSTMYHIHAEL